MREHCQHLCQRERSVIYHMIQAGKTQTEIARCLGRSQGTISKELKRNGDGKSYKIREAQGKEAKRKRSKARSYFCNPYHSWEKGGVENFNRLVRK